MNEILSKISLYHRLFLACLTGSLILLAAAIGFFVAPDVRSAFACLTGRRERKEIQRMERENVPGKAAGHFLKTERKWMDKATEILPGAGRYEAHRNTGLSGESDKNRREK